MADKNYPPPKSPFIIRYTFSNWNVDKPINPPAPWLSFCLTIEQRWRDAPAADYFLRLTIPGCMFSPYKPGLDGKLGRFKGPVAWGMTGTTVQSLSIEPNEILSQIEIAARTRPEVQRWKRKADGLYANLGINPENPIELKSLKRRMRTKSHFKKGE